MAVTIDVPYEVLAQAKREWDSAADRLDGSFRHLLRASTASLSPAAASAVETFRQRWADELKSCGGQAQGYSDAFYDTGTDFLVTDVAEAELIRSVLPWSWRDARIEGR